jgi:hypothetical protein
MKNKPMIKIYNEYYKCGTSSCDSIYHISNFMGPQFDCRDCKKISDVPDEALPRRKFKKKERK